MASEWREYTFSELIDVGALEIGDGYRAKVSELGGDGPIFLRAGHVTDTHIDFSGVDRFRGGVTSALASKMSMPGDVIVTTKGNSTGRVAFVDSNMPSFVYSPHLSYWRSLDQEAIVPGFLRYWSRSREFHIQLAGFAASTDMAPYLSLIDQKRLKVVLPSSSEQRGIAKILTSLDDKLQFNRRMNETLEAMAHALFKSWFVDFDPVRAKIEGNDTIFPKSTADLFPDSLQDSEIGEIPAGWNVGSIENIAEINALTLSRTDPLNVIDYVEISEVMRGDVAHIVRYERGGEPSRARRRLRHGDTVLSTVRPDRGAYFLALNPAETLVASTGFAVLTPIGGVWAFLYSLATRREISEHLGHLADGGAYPAVRPEVIAKIRVALPPILEPVLRFEQLVRPLYEKSAQNRTQSRTLGQIRDALLPKLISGELRLPDAGRIMGRQM